MHKKFGALASERLLPWTLFLNIEGPVKNIFFVKKSCTQDGMERNY